MTDNRLILKWVKGYSIHFCNKPVQFTIPKVILKEIDIAAYKNTIYRLVTLSIVSETKMREDSFLSSYFLLPKQDGSFRFILNLKKLNTFLNAPHFKLEDYRTVIKILKQGDYLTRIDLKDAYYSVNIKETDRKFLSFQFENKVYHFNRLPFGISTAPFVFTKLMKPVVEKFRKIGIRCVIYLDDILIFSRSYEEAKVNTKVIIDQLIQLGFKLNYKKCSLLPSQECTFLGFRFNSIYMFIALPKDKTMNIVKLTEDLTIKKACKLKEFASYIGTLVSVCPAVNYGWVHIKRFERELYKALKSKKGNYNAKMRLSPELQKEFSWWITHVKSNKMPIRQGNFCCEIFSDSSRTGWGGHTGTKTIFGFWTREQLTQHINHLELLAAFNTLQNFAKNLHDCEILLRLDNKTAVAYINKMGGVRHAKLSKIARNIWEWCEIRNIWVYASYIPSSLNSIADAESRRNPNDTEYMLSSAAYSLITRKLNTPEIDLFASSLNKKCERFISWKPDPQALHIDAFTISWKHFFFYAFPPFAQIPNVLNKIINEKAKGIVVVPLWPSQPWYPIYNNLLCKEPIIFKPNKELLTSPYRQTHPLWGTLSLVAGILSGKCFDEEGYRKKDYQ